MRNVNSNLPFHPGVVLLLVFIVLGVFLATGCTTPGTSGPAVFTSLTVYDGDGNVQGDFRTDGQTTVGFSLGGAAEGGVWLKSAAGPAPLYFSSFQETGKVLVISRERDYKESFDYPGPIPAWVLDSGMYAQPGKLEELGLLVGE